MILQAKDIIGSYFWFRSSLFLVIADPGGKILALNPFAKDLIKQEDHPDAFLDLCVFFKNRPEWKELKKDNGTRYLWSVNRQALDPVSFYFGFSGIDAGYLIVGEQDISEFLTYQSRFLELSREMSQMTRSLQKSNVELEQKNKQINLFLGMAAHDMRNPAGIILNFSHFLQDELKDTINEQQMVFLDKVVQQSEHLLRILNDLLDVVSIQRGEVNLKVEDLDLVKILRANLEINRVFANKKEIALTFSNTFEKAPIRADAHKIEQVFNNLISNAIKYSHPQSQVKISLEEEEDRYRIMVCDQGIGIPEAKIPQLFEPFVTHTKSGTAGEKSTGLGLVIVKHIVDAHGGRISVESKPGVGSTFAIILPKNHNTT